MTFIAVVVYDVELMTLILRGPVPALRLSRWPFEHQRADFVLTGFAQHQNLVKFHISPAAVEFFNGDNIVFGDTILLAAGANNCVHRFVHLRIQQIFDR